MGLDPTPRPWADLVFHVLAHVHGTAGLAASVYDPRYVAFAERRLGPAAARTLAEDAAALGALAPTHEALARTQLLAWLFRDLDRPSAVVAKELGALEAADVDAPELLSALAQEARAVELLRCAAELERDLFETLGPPRFDADALAKALDRATEVAPGLALGRVACVRSLALRGRVLGDEIWVGAPDEELGVSVEHAAWQASHEATVREVGEAARRARLGASERDVEAASVVLLAERASAAKRAEEHSRWLGVFGAAGPTTDRASLSSELGRLVAEQLAQPAAGGARSGT